MSVALPLANSLWPMHRIVTKDSWGGNAGVWTEQPMWDKYSATGNHFGFEVLSYSRVALPAVGECRIRFRFGKIDGRIVAPSDATALALSAGAAWTSVSDTIMIPNLRRKEIRVQAAPRVAAGTTPAWRTVWWGQCEHQEITDMAGAPIPSGECVYHCADGLFRTKRWTIRQHGLYLFDPNTNTGTNQGHLYGHPGYNSVDKYGVTRGNKSTESATWDPTATIAETGGDNLLPVRMHTWVGAGDRWTDREAVEHCINVSRPKNEPVFLLAGSTDYYTQATGSPWPVLDDDNAFDFLNRVCRRQRGRGLTFLDWDDDAATPLGVLNVCIRVRPQTLGNVTYQAPPTVDTNNNSTPGATVTLSGATASGTTIAIDLIGDQRVVPGSLTLGDRDTHRVDWLESRGEQIQVLVTLSRFDGNFSLTNRWSAASEAAFKALSPIKRVEEAARPVFQLYGLPRAWKGDALDHNNGTSVELHKVDYQCTDAGLIVFSGSPVAGAPDAYRMVTSPVLVEVMPDLPLFEGYTYATSPPVRKDGLSESGCPPRRPPLVLVRTAPNRYVPGEFAIRPIGIHVSDDGILMSAPSDMADQQVSRVVGDTTDATLGSAYNNNQIGCTVGLKLPHHIRYATTGMQPDGVTPIAAENIRRRRTITHNNIHLWLASPGAIWDLDITTNDAYGYPAKRNACGATTGAPGILRDDRAVLANLHALAATWYLTERRTATWGIRDCGMLPGYSYADGNGVASGTTAYATLGKVVTTMTAGGQAHTINTPVTSITYDNEIGVTTWATDWAELDFV